MSPGLFPTNPVGIVTLCEQERYGYEGTMVTSVIASPTIR
jgi:hypothetical protein